MQVLHLNSLGIAPILLERLLKCLQDTLIRNDDAQLAILIKGLCGNILRANEGFLPIYHHDFCMHVQSWIFSRLDACLFNGIDTVSVTIGRRATGSGEDHLYLDAVLYCRG